MPVITITTEWQGFDYHNGVLKGKLAQACPGVQVIENSTGIPPFNIQQAAFIIRNTFRHYPEGSVHIICVQSEYSEKSPHLVVKAQGHYFIGTDNGIFNLILNSAPEKIIRIENSPGGTNNDESGLFARTAAIFIAGGNPEDAGTPVDSFNDKVPLRATIEEDAITGSIIFIDSYGNAISNITRDIFMRIFSKKQYRIAIRSNSNTINHISSSYNSEGISDLLALFNSLDLLEIGINGSNAAELLSLRVGDTVRVAAPGSNKKPGTLF